MALSKVGGGYQYTDGNVNEITIGTQAAPATATVTATLTAAQIANGLIVANPGGSAAATYTLPTVALLEATVTNAKVNSAFDFSINNVSVDASEDVTVAAGTGWTLSGLMVVANTTAGSFRARKTGDATWTLYRLA